MPIRRALLALLFSMALTLAVALVSGPRAAHGTEVEGACGDRPCEESVPDSGACGDRPCEDSVPDSGACGDRPCDEVAPDVGPCGDQPCGDTQQPDTGPCGDQPCDEPDSPDGAGINETLPGTQEPTAGPVGDDDGATAITEPDEKQTSPDADVFLHDGPGAREDLEGASADEGSFPATPVAVGLAAALLIALVLAMRSRRSR